MIKRDLFVLLLVFYAYTTRRADRMGSEWSCKTRIRVVGLNFSDFLIKGMEFQFELAGNSSYPS